MHFHHKRFYNSKQFLFTVISKFIFKILKGKRKMMDLRGEDWKMWLFELRERNLEVKNK